MISSAFSFVLFPLLAIEKADRTKLLFKKTILFLFSYEDARKPSAFLIYALGCALAYTLFSLFSVSFM